MTNNTEKNFRIPTPVILTAIMFYYELLLKIWTAPGHLFPELIYIFLFSSCHAILIWLLTSFSRNPSLNRKLRLLIIMLIAVLFLVNYFVFKQFKIFYDLQTVFKGAGDAVGNFQSNIVSLLFSPDGIILVILYFIPTVLYSRYARRIDAAKKLQLLVAVNWFLADGVLYLITLILISISTIYWPAFTNQYNFQTAIGDFGLITGLELDVDKILFSGGSVHFDNLPDEPAETAVPEEEKPEETEAPVVYEKNMMDIDFESLDNDGGLCSSMDAYVSSLTPTSKNEFTGIFKGKNLIMITAEAFTAEVIDPELTPTLYRLATKGINFTDYYQPATAGTTGGEYQILFGSHPINGGSSLKLTANYHNYMTFASQMNRIGYNGWAFHNNIYTFYDRNITHNNLGYSNGFMGNGNGMEQFVQDTLWPESDLEMMEGTIPMYIDQEPFNVYYMSVSGHNNYSTGENDMAKKNWNKVKDLDYSDRVKGYLAANLELENAVTYLVEQLEEKGIADDTVIVLSADHFPYGLDDGRSLGSLPYLDELYGYHVDDYLDRDHNRLIIWSGSLEKEEPVIVDDPVSSLDILPTLCNLFDTEWDSRLFVGRDVFSDAMPLVFTMSYDWKTDLGRYYSSTAQFVPNDPETKVSDEYIANVRTIVQNKMMYCTGIGNADYFYHLFKKEINAAENE